MHYLSCLLVVVLVAALSDAANLTVALPYTTFVGSTNRVGIYEFKGIRYAEPPLGDLRFRKPADPLKNDKVQIADEFGPSCLATDAVNLTSANSEDCLTLNVFAPLPEKKLRPVWVFIQGGGFNTVGNFGWNPSGIISSSDNNIVVVTFNYRLGPYGFLASKEVVADGDLNAAMFDQRKVLEWVQLYIEQFGGDPTKVTISGDSAGAASVDLHLSAYGGGDDGLFRAAFAHSQSFGAQFTVTESQYQYDRLISRVGCSGANDTLACLRSLSTAQIQSKNIKTPTPGGGGGVPAYMYGNVIDDSFTPDYTYNLYATGQFLKVPVYFGSVPNEGTGFAPKNASTVSDLTAFLRNNFVKLLPAQLAKIAAFYPPAEQFPDSGSFWRATSNAYGEMRYNCPGIAMSQAYAKFGNGNNWLYNYNVTDAADEASGEGVYHTVNTRALWGTDWIPDSVSRPASYNTTNQAITPVLRGYVTSFIRTGDPNVYRAPGSPTWQRFGGEKMERILFETNRTRMEVVDEGERERCAYLSAIGGTVGM